MDLCQDIDTEEEKTVRWADRALWHAYMCDPCPSVRKTMRGPNFYSSGTVYQNCLHNYTSVNSLPPAPKHCMVQKGQYHRKKISRNGGPIMSNATSDNNVCSFTNTLHPTWFNHRKSTAPCSNSCPAQGARLRQADQCTTQISTQMLRKHKETRSGRAVLSPHALPTPFCPPSSPSSSPPSAPLTTIPAYG